MSFAGFYRRTKLLRVRFGLRSLVQKKYLRTRKNFKDSCAWLGCGARQEQPMDGQSWNTLCSRSPPLNVRGWRRGLVHALSLR